MRGVLLLCCLAMLVPRLGTPAQVRAPERVVVLVASSASESVRDATNGVRKRLEYHGVRVAQEVQLATAGLASLTSWRDRPVDVFVAIGPQAAEALRDFSRVPVVSTLVLDPMAGARGTGVGIDFPVEQQVQVLRRLLPPHVKRVGVVYNPVQNERTITRMRDAGRANDLEIVARPAASPSDIPQALASLTSAADVLWGINDQVVMTPETARSILLFSMRNRLPLIGLSSAWVKAGALLALDRDYGDLGAQAADQVARILDGESPASVRAEAPRRLVYSLNQRTAELMNVKLSEDAVRNAREVIR